MTLFCYTVLMKAFVYILTNQTNEVLYIGVTNNIARRMYEHQTKILPGFTEKYNLTKLVLVETCNSIIDAIKREKQLKAWRRSWKRELITQQNPHWEDLSKHIL